MSSSGNNTVSAQAPVAPVQDPVENDQEATNVTPTKPTTKPNTTAPKRRNGSLDYTSYNKAPPGADV